MDGADSPDATPVTLPGDVLSRYPRFSLYNSPYPAHDRGCAIDLYPETNAGLSPVAGEVLDTRTVRCPDRPYAVDHDHLILIDTGSHVARVLHVDPAVEPGDNVSVGDSLGEMVRSGFFGQWVDNHVHLGFRSVEQNPYRAGGSLPVAVDVSVDPIRWDGTGEVVAVGETYAALAAPAHPAPGERFAGIAADDGTVLDGGLAHYAGGGALTNSSDDRPDGRSLSLFGARVGVANGRHVEWDDIDVLANGDRLVGLSLFAAREDGFGAKLVAFDHDFAVGDAVEITIRPSSDPIRLG